MSNNHTSPLELSLGTADTSGAVTSFTRKSVDVRNLQNTLTSHNYSFIAWNGSRLSEHFAEATGFCVDSDEGMAIAEGLKKVEALDVNYALITTRSHTADAHRFRILIPFNRPVLALTNYKEIVKKLHRTFFPTTDDKVLDGARQFFASPTSAEYHSCWTKSHYNVDGDETQISAAWHHRLLITLSDGKTQVEAAQLKEKTAIMCPFHPDTTASAFVSMSTTSDNHYIHCSACGKTFWMEKPEVPMEKRFERFYSYGTTVVDVGITGDKFFMEDIGRDKFFHLTDAFEKEEKLRNMRYLVRHKHIRHLVRIDHLGDIEAPASTYIWKEAQGVFEVHYKAIEACEQNNQFIEDYLERLFGPFKQFIKEWLAFYVYTNWKKLPTIILNGPRGTGKNSFAEMLMSIYPGLSQYWHGKEKSFSPEVEKKLLVADESTSDAESQYRMLKKYSGSDKMVVNKKYMAEYTALNNMNIIILSNLERPIHVESTELPTDEKNNQFFVHKMKPLTGPIDTMLPERLKKYLGHYIRTELANVFAQIRFYTDCRYSICVPITDAEKDLFDLNKSDLDEELDKILDKVASDGAYREFYEAGYVPKSLITTFYLPRGISKNDIYRRLKELGWCEPSRSSAEEPRKTFGAKQERCLVMTQKMKDWYKAQQTPKEPAPARSQIETERQTELGFVSESVNEIKAEAA